MIPPGSSLTSPETALKELAVHQAEALQATLQRLQAIPASRADSEALADSAELVERGAAVLRDWYGGEPATP